MERNTLTATEVSARWEAASEAVSENERRITGELTDRLAEGMARQLARSYEESAIGTRLTSHWEDAWRYSEVAYRDRGVDPRPAAHVSLQGSDTAASLRDPMNSDHQRAISDLCRTGTIRELNRVMDLIESAIDDRARSINEGDEELLSREGQEATEGSYDF